MTRSRSAFLFVACVVAAGPWASATQAQEAVKLVTTVTPGVRIAVQVEAMVKAVFTKLGVAYTLEFNPAQRAAAGFQSGYFDGDVARVEAFGEIFPDAIQVLPGHQTDYYVMMGKKPLPDVKSFAQLGSYRIAYRRGYKGIEARTEHVRERTAVDSWESCLAMVVADRVDVCLGILLGYGKAGPDLSATPLGKILLEDGQKKQFVTTRIGEAKNYIWFTPKNRDLAARTSAALKGMEQSGELDAIFAH